MLKKTTECNSLLMSIVLFKVSFQSKKINNFLMKIIDGLIGAIKGDYRNISKKIKKLNDNLFLEVLK